MLRHCCRWRPVLLLVLSVGCCLLAVICGAAAASQALPGRTEELESSAELSRQRRAPCGSFDCMNGGICNTSGPIQVCSCPKPYTGNNCSAVENYCNKLQPEKNITALPVCLNGATCTSIGTDPYFSCRCASNYTGTRCETVNTCAFANPCVNGQCAFTSSGAECRCYAGWTGARCETDYDFCLAGPCKNGGRCTDGNSTFTCDCSATDFWGASCTNWINDCQPDPCSNGATCTDGLKNFTCKCLDGYSGKDCSEDFPDCSPNPCAHNATCLERSKRSWYGIASLPAPFNGQFRYSQAAGYVCDYGYESELSQKLLIGLGIGIAVGFVIGVALALLSIFVFLYRHRQGKLHLGYFERPNSKDGTDTDVQNQYSNMPVISSSMEMSAQSAVTAEGSDEVYLNPDTRRNGSPEQQSHQHSKSRVTEEPDPVDSQVYQQPDVSKGKSPDQAEAPNKQTEKRSKKSKEKPNKKSDNKGKKVISHDQLQVPPGALGSSVSLPGASNSLAAEQKRMSQPPPRPPRVGSTVSNPIPENEEVYLCPDNIQDIQQQQQQPEEEAIYVEPDNGSSQPTEQQPSRANVPPAKMPKPKPRGQNQQLQQQQPPPLELDSHPNNRASQQNNSRHDSERNGGETGGSEEPAVYDEIESVQKSTNAQQQQQQKPNKIDMSEVARFT